MYNADHTFWKNITLPKPDGYSITGLDLLSENELNADNLIEVGYHCSNNSQGESRIVNENGELMLIATNPGRFQVSSLDGMPNKLMVYYLTGDLPDETSRRTDVYSVPGFNLEHTYQQTVFRVKLEISGDKYHAYDYDYLTSDITIFNNDHTLWKTIETSAQPGETIENVFITEKKIDADNALELMYTIATNNYVISQFKKFFGDISEPITPKETGWNDRDLVIEVVKETGVINNVVEKRVVDVSKQ